MGCLGTCTEEGWKGVASSERSYPRTNPRGTSEQGAMTFCAKREVKQRCCHTVSMRFRDFGGSNRDRGRGGRKGCQDPKQWTASKLCTCTNKSLRSSSRRCDPRHTPRFPLPFPSLSLLNSGTRIKPRRTSNGPPTNMEGVGKRGGETEACGVSWIHDAEHGERG